MSGYQQTDYQKLRERFLSRQQQKDQEQGWWKPEVGRHTVRFLPPAQGMDLWFFEYGVHYGIWPDQENTTETCPRLTTGAPCPICDFVRTLYRSTSDEDKANARRIGAKKRYGSNVLVLSGDRASEVRIWAYGNQVWDALMEQVNLQEGILPIEDPQGGYNVTLSVTQKKTGDSVFPHYTPVVSRTATPIDPAVLGHLHDIRGMIMGKLRSADVIRAAMIGKPNPDAADPVPPPQAQTWPAPSGPRPAQPLAPAIGVPFHQPPPAPGIIRFPVTGAAPVRPATPAPQPEEIVESVDMPPEDPNHAPKVDPTLPAQGGTFVAKARAALAKAQQAAPGKPQ